MTASHHRRTPAAAPPLAFLVLLLLATATSASAPSSPKNSKILPPSIDLDDAAGGHKLASAVFPLYGNVYPHGFYFASMSIGEPPKPYFLDVDTGSDLTWLQCDAPCVHCSKGPHPLYRPRKNKLVPCKDPLCVALHSSTNHDQHCDAPNQCDYEIQYADQMSSLGVLITDAFALRLTNRSIVQPQLAFGCGYDQQGAGAAAPSPTDGVLGLGSGKASILSQLKEQGVVRSVVGHCFSGRGGGFLFFGDGLVPSSGVTWSPMSRSPMGKHYSPGSARFYLGKQSLGGKEEPVVFDSGSSYTYFTNQPYQAFLSAVKKDLNRKALKEVFDDPALPVCWKGPKPFRSAGDVKMYFRSLVLGFVGRKRAQLEIPPENYLIVTEHGNACLGILNGTEVGLKDLNIIGDVSFQDLMVIYDNENQQIGWVQTSCSRLPNADGIDDFRGGFCKPQFANIGVLSQECPAYYK